MGPIRIGCSRKEIEIRIREGNPPEKNSDNGLEFCEGEFREFYKNDEIFRHLTVRKIPQQNGVAEHMNRTLLERARCMLSNAGLSREFLLAEAFSTAYYLVNRSPHSSLEFKTPEEVWSGSPPNYSDWKIFVCPFYLVTGVQEEASKGKALLSVCP